jgi:6,7-dimethyl-8-ribityllumazine synthase
LTSEGSPVERSRGSVDATGLRVAVLAARFNSDITDRLLQGSLEALREHDVA